MAYYRSCPHCGANLDPGEQCDCAHAMYSRLTVNGKRMIDDLVQRLLAEQNSRPLPGSDKERPHTQPADQSAWI